MHAPRFHLRSYAASWGGDRHRFAQWVLPLTGEIEFELDGQGARLGCMQGAFVAPGEFHDQVGEGPNRHLIIDCGRSWFDDDTLHALRTQRWLALPGALRAALAAADGGDPTRLLPLLVRAFARTGSGARLRALCMELQLSPGDDWPVERMAARAGLSSSHLHAVFVREYGLPPQAWLAELRLRWARHLLRTTALPITAIAHAAGYSEQSALTRALRRHAGTTPAAWRRQP